MIMGWIATAHSVAAGATACGAVPAARAAIHLVRAGHDSQGTHRLRRPESRLNEQAKEHCSLRIVGRAHTSAKFRKLFLPSVPGKDRREIQGGIAGARRNEHDEQTR